MMSTIEKFTRSTRLGCIFGCFCELFAAKAKKEADRATGYDDKKTLGNRKLPPLPQF